LNVLYSIGLLLVLRQWEPNTTAKHAGSWYRNYIIPSEVCVLAIWVLFAILQGLSTPQNADDFSVEIGLSMWAAWVMTFVVM
jgi:hypothetical protein